MFLDWRYDNEMNESSTNEEAPKFEDFLGNCYSNSPPPHNDAGEINVNVAPNFDDQGSSNHALFYPPYQYAAANPDAAYLGGGAGSGFKSWLQQPPAEAGGGHCDLQALSLTVKPSSHPHPDVAAPAPLQAVVADGKKRAVAKSAAAKESVPRKSIDTFGQRTSQYRGVTR